MASPKEQVQLLCQQMQQSIVGQEDVIERLVLALLANGNGLMEGLPGLGNERTGDTGRIPAPGRSPPVLG